MLKGDAPEKLFAAIRIVADGHSIQRRRGARIARPCRRKTRRSGGQPAPPHGREKQIAYLVARGMKNKDIALQLGQRKRGEPASAEHLQQKRRADRLELAVIASDRKIQRHLAIASAKQAFVKGPGRVCVAYCPVVAAIFFTIASASLQSLSFSVPE